MESPAKDERLHAKTFRIIISPFALAWHILRWSPAVVHLNSAADHKAFWRDLVYLLVAKSFRKKVVVQFHGGSLDQLCAYRWMQWFARVVFNMSDALVLLATSERAEFEQLGVRKRLTIIPNGVDVSEYRGPVDRVHSGKVRRLIYLGRIAQDKGIREAIEAVATLRTDPCFNDIQLLIAGSGPAYTDLREFIQARALDSRVELVGPLFGNKKVEFLRQADVFVFPTYHKERMPYSILESLAAGTPVIASRIAGIPDVVIDRVHGILIEPGSTDEVVRALRELASSQEALRAMSRNCLDWASQTLGLDRLAAQFGELYDTLQT